MTRVRRAALPPSSYTEREWDRQVRELAMLYGWDYVYHTTRSKMSPWGWPDLVLVRRRDSRIVFAELKTSSGVATPDQIGVLELLLDVAGGGYTASRNGSTPDGGHARIDVELWRPGDIDRVMEVLK